MGRQRKGRRREFPRGGILRRVCRRSWQQQLARCHWRLCELCQGGLHEVQGPDQCLRDMERTAAEAVLVGLQEPSNAQEIGSNAQASLRRHKRLRQRRNGPFREPAAKGIEWRHEKGKKVHPGDEGRGCTSGRVEHTHLHHVPARAQPSSGLWKKESIGMAQLLSQGTYRD